MNLPNKLTLGRFVLTVLFLVIFFSRTPFNETVALVLFVVASITDYYDGMIARRDKLITNFGILMDPLADKILVCSAFIAFVGRDLVPAWMVVIIVARELAITGLRLLAASKNVVNGFALITGIATMCFPFMTSLALNAGPGALNFGIPVYFAN